MRMWVWLGAFLSLMCIVGLSGCTRQRIGQRAAEQLPGATPGAGVSPESGTELATEHEVTASAKGAKPLGKGPCCPGEGVLPGWLDPPEYYIQPVPESSETDEGLVLHARVRMLARFADVGLVQCVGKVVDAWMRADEYKTAVRAELTMAMDQDDGQPPGLGRVIWTRDSGEPPEPGAVKWDQPQSPGHYWFVPPAHTMAG